MQNLHENKFEQALELIANAQTTEQLSDIYNYEARTGMDPQDLSRLREVIDNRNQQIHQ